jgi:hypothetical protein
MTKEEIEELALAIGGTPVDILAKYANGEKLEVGSLYRALDILCSAYGRVIAQKGDIFMCLEQLNSESTSEYQNYKFLLENGDIFTFCYDPTYSFCEKVNP